MPAVIPRVSRARIMKGLLSSGHFSSRYGVSESPRFCNHPCLCLNAKPNVPAQRPEPQTSNSKAQRSWLASPTTAATSSKHQTRRGHLQKPVTRKPRSSLRRMRPIEVSSGNSSVLSTSISWKEFRVFRRKRRSSKAGTSVPLNLTWLGTAIWREALRELGNHPQLQYIIVYSTVYLRHSIQYIIIYHNFGVLLHRVGFCPNPPPVAPSGEPNAHSRWSAPTSDLAPIGPLRESNRRAQPNIES